MFVVLRNCRSRFLSGVVALEVFQSCAKSEDSVSIDGWSNSPSELHIGIAGWKIGLTAFRLAAHRLFQTERGFISNPKSSFRISGRVFKVTFNFQHCGKFIWGATAVKT